MDSLASRVVALEERLDARKVKQAPGQLGLDLTGGRGEPCGESFIAPEKVCRKGEAAAAKPASNWNDATTDNLMSRLPELPKPGESPDALPHGEHYEATAKMLGMGHAAYRYSGGHSLIFRAYQMEQAVAAGYKVDVFSRKLAKNVEWGEDARRAAERDVPLLEELIARMPKYEGEVFRGMKFRDEKAAQRYIDSLTQPGMMTAAIESWTATRQVAEGFTKRRDATVVLKQRNRYGAPIAGYSAMPGEGEVLMPSGVQYKVLQISEGTADGVPRYEVEVEAVAHRPYPVNRLDALVAQLQRLDARRIKQAPGQLALGLEAPGGGSGKPCGESFIARTKTCRKGEAAAPTRPPAPAAPPAAKGPSPRVLAFLAGAEERKRLREQDVAAAREKLARPGGPGLLIELGEGGEPQIGGRGPAKRLGGGAFGDTFLFDLEDGTQAVVKVDRPGNTDPLNRDMQLTGENERMLMTQRELGMLGAAAELGISPRPLSQGVSRLSDGRFAFAYEFAPGSTLCPDHTTNMLTPGAMATLQKPEAMARFAEGLAKIARAAATAGLDHRDEHGGNLLVLEDGTPQLLDWAMARRQPTDPTHQGAIEAGMVRTFGDIAGVTRIAPGHKPAIAEFLSQAAHDAFRAQYADLDILEEWMMEQPDKKEQRTKEKIKLANAIQKAHPYRNFFWAEVDAGIIPHPDPETMAAAQAAKDKVFSADHLRRMRRTIDQHMARWRSSQ